MFRGAAGVEGACLRWRALATTRSVRYVGVASRGVCSISRPDDKVARITMGSTPVNTMNLPFIEELSATIKEVEADRKVNSLILDSSCKVSHRTACVHVRVTSSSARGRHVANTSKHA